MPGGQLAASQLVPGATLVAPCTATGKVKITWPYQPEAPRVKFAIRVALPAESNYIQSKAASNAYLYITLLPNDDARDAVEADNKLVQAASGKTLEINLAGAVVKDVQTEGKGKRVVHIEARGPQLVIIEGVKRALLNPRVDEDGAEWFHTPIPEPASRHAEPTKPKETRGNAAAGRYQTLSSLVSAIPQLVFSAAGMRKRRPSEEDLVNEPQKEGEQPPNKRARIEEPPQRVNAPPHHPDALPLRVSLDLRNGTSSAPANAIEDPPVRPLLPTPSTVVSRADTIETPPSSSVVASAIVNASGTSRRSGSEAPQPTQPTEDDIRRRWSPRPMSVPALAGRARSPFVGSSPRLSPVSPDLKEVRERSRLDRERREREAREMMERAERAREEKERAEAERMRAEAERAEKEREEGRKRLAERLANEAKERREKQAVEEAARRAQEEQRKQQDERQAQEEALRQARQHSAVQERQQQDEQLQDNANRETEGQQSAAIERTNGHSPAVPANDYEMKRRSSKSPVKDVVALRAAREAKARAAANAEEERRQAEDQRHAANEAEYTTSFVTQNGTYEPILEVRNRYSGNFVNVMGVILSVKSCVKPQGARTDWFSTVVIADPSSHTEGNASDDMTVTVFRKTEAELRDIAVGLPVAFRGLKISTFGGKVKGQAFSNATNEWFVLWPDRVARSTSGAAGPPLSPLERDRLKQLASWWRSQPDAASTEAPSDVATSSKEARLWELGPGQFANVTVKIMHVTDNPYLNSAMPKYELYVCDGTVNELPARNFHQVDAHLPPSAMLNLRIKDEVPGEETKFREGAIVRIPNVLAKLYQNELELIWSDKVTDLQEAQKWKRRTAQIIPASDPRAQEIEKRIKELREATRNGLPAPPNPPRLAGATRLSPGKPQRPVFPATKAVIRSKYPPDSTHPVMSFSAVLKDSTAQQRVLVRARVRSILPCGMKGARTDLAVLRCKRCAARFAGEYCQSCNDVRIQHAEVAWQMVLVLEPEDGAGESLYVVLAGKEAEAILPPLPPICAGPNEVARLRKRLAEFTPGVEEVLLGARLDGERPRYPIDWSLESFVVTAASTPVRVWRVFGMTRV